MERTSNLSEESALVYAHRTLKDKDNTIMELKEETKALQKKLDHEMAHSDHVSDLNVRFKQEIRRLKEKLKVTVLPVALKKLSEQAQEQDQTIRTLRRALVAAMDLIPDTDQNKDDKEALRKFYDQIA